MSDFNSDINENSMGSVENSDVLSDEQKTNIISQIIDDLATDTKYSNNNRYIFHIKALESVYCDGNYKDKYSDIFSTLCKYLENKEVSLEVLQINLEKLSSNITPTLVSNTTFKSFENLEDLINVEISRYGFYNAKKVDKADSSDNLCTEEVKGKLKKLESDVEISNSVTLEAKKAIIHVDDKIEKNSLSSITALSVFSAVVLAFSGGMTVVSGVLGEMSGVSPLRVAFVGSLLGFILFNTVFMLLYVVGIITGRHISQQKKLTFCENSAGQPNIFCRVIHKYLYVFAVNAIFITLMYYSAVIYLFKSNALCPTFPLYLKIAAGILPIFVFILVSFFSYQPYSDKIQQKRLYNSYKVNILSILVTNNRISGKLNGYRRKSLNFNNFDKTAENEVAQSIALDIASLKNKSTIKKIIDKKVREGFMRYYLLLEDSSFISFNENRKAKRKIKTILNFIMSRLTN